MAGQTYGFSYTYDLAGDLTSEMYPSGRVLNTTFDVGETRGRLTCILGVCGRGFGVALKFLALGGDPETPG